MSTAQVVAGRSAVGERRREAKPWALAILCVLIPILPAYVVPGGPLKSNGAPAKVLALWLFGLVVLGFVAGRRTGRERRINPGVAVLLVYFFAWLWIYGLGRLHIDDPLLEAAKSRAVIALIANIGAALYVFARIKTIRDRDFVLGALLIGLAFECAVGLLQGVASVDLRFLFQPPGFVVNTTDLTLDERIGAKRVIGTAQHAIEFSVLAVAAVPLGVYFARNARRGEVRVLAAVAALLGLAAMPAAVSRSGVISLVVALLVYMFYFRVRTIAIAATALVLAVVGYIAIFPTVVNALWGTITGSADDPSIKHRTEDYAGVSRIFHDHPYFGLGLGGQPHLLDNEWLQTVVQGGIFGIAAMIVLSGGALFGVSGGLRAARTRREREQAFMLGAVVAAILVSSTTFDLFYYQQATLIFFITFALLWSTYSIPAQGGGGLGRSRFRRDPPPGGLPATNGRAESHAPEPKPPAAENAPAVTEPEPPAAVQGPPVADTESLAASLEPPATDAESPAVGKGLSSGVRWTSVSMVGREIARTGFTVLLARLIGPDAFGIVAQATVYLGILSLLLDQGFASALIQRPTLDRYMPGATMTVNIGVGAVLAAVTIGIAPAWAAFMHTPDLKWVLIALAPSLIVRAAAITPRAMLWREMEFRKNGIADITSALLGGAVGLAVVLAGGTYWALVAQLVTTDLVITVVLIAVAGSWPNLRLNRLREIAGFSWRAFVGAVLVNSLARNADNLLIGRFQGAQALAFYALAYRLLLLPVQLTVQSIGSVLFPLFARLADNLPALRAELARATRIMALVALPGMALVSIAAPQLIQLVFGSAWAPAIPIVRVLAMAGALPAVYQPSTIPVMLGLGHAKLQLRYAVLCTAVSIGGIVAGLPFGPFGVAVGYSAATVALLPVEWVVRRRCVGVSLRTQFTQLLPGLHIAFWMAAAYASIALILPGHDFVILCAGTAVALAVGAVVLRLAYRTQLDEILHLVRRVAGKRGNDTEPAPEPPAARTADPSGTRSP
ncbi:oligosaccharide flippase family protein [Nocardia seriolae]|uniref:oligosaccharide flippase family protein n=1 Tax=Nocardia seriolae TaxID=37332 RepID=UPI0007C642B4|nr:oligosaccharide flippase family protein [Nocardia seriolae]MTJ61590.1 oligosaccharide flippase family protein [Nocardia seriolae]MTJ71557.1 oligosaccharide flippase family protein [Nocardia seriolae]MTJ86610.1 oligosaccharide flippase family protein [Nocardia seriolae]MTK30605.1 oligosaccharide flippase family protein [Nocardia seriolae]MTK39558.1 oligosaccharide flippase family protein [Nocardia seriolae]